jgi:hypothetical protein
VSLARTLYDERGPFGGVPHATHVDTTVRAFSLSSDFNTSGRVIVQGTDNHLWNERPPFGSVPPSRTHVDGNVFKFSPVFSNANEVAVEVTDGKLWLETL